MVLHLTRKTSMLLSPGLHVDDATFSIPEIQDIGARLRRADIK
jgi:hypothetical protein